MSQQSPINEFTETAMSNLRAMIDVNTVIGDPIVTPTGITIIPISKVSFGYGTGGSDLPTQAPNKFLGGTGGGVTLQPIGFLVINGDDVKILQMTSADNTGDRLVNAGAGLVDRVLDFIPNKSKSSGIVSGSASATKEPKEEIKIEKIDDIVKNIPKD